jgi:LuxR family maltose regulon positive regulatory protein
VSIPSVDRIVVATKLHIPAARPGQVHRRALIDQLEDASDAALLLVAAAPGSGKSTLLGDWCASSRSRDFAWLSLDVEDGDPVQFWTCVIEALRRIRPGIGAQARAALEAPGTSLTASVLPALVNELADVDGSIALILDDYHLIADGDVHRSMAWLLEHRPPAMQIVVATRSDPPFPLARLRARGQLLELRATDLRFSDDEAEGLLNGALGLGLQRDDVARLQSRTEGWAAGLQLAGLSLRGRPDPREFIESFAGDDRQIVDYLGAEVLDTQPDELRRFMRRTSILARMSAPLCEAVTGEAGSATRLSELERANLFVVPLDANRRWYRYHHLFADLLRHDLELSEHDAVAELHRRAAAWFRADGDIAEAIHHALTGGDDDQASELVAAHWSEFFNRGRLATVSRWLAALPPDRVAGDSRLWLARVWTSMDRGRLDEVAPLLELDGSTTGDAEDLGSWVEVLRALHRFKAGDVGGAEADARRAISRDREPPAFRRTVAVCVLGIAEHWRGDLVAARATLASAQAQAHADENGLAALYATGYLALGALDLGELRAADDALDESTALIEREAGLGEHFVAAVTHLAAGRRRLVGGDAEAAAPDLERAVELAQRGASVVEQAAALVSMADARRALGDTAAARSLLDDARELVTECVDPGRVAGLLATAERPLARAGSAQPLAGELSERELAVLRLLPTGLSQREIGSTLYVSLNTVKSHTRRIFGKLEVGGREEAVRRARELGLL